MHFKRLSLFYIVCLSTVDECTFLHDTFFTEREKLLFNVCKTSPSRNWKHNTGFFIISKENWKKVSRFCVDLINGLFGGFWLAGCFFLTAACEITVTNDSELKKPSRMYSLHHFSLKHMLLLSGHKAVNEERADSGVFSRQEVHVCFLLSKQTHSLCFRCQDVCQGLVFTFL